MMKNKTFALPQILAAMVVLLSLCVAQDHAHAGDEVAAAAECEKVVSGFEVLLEANKAEEAKMEEEGNAAAAAIQEELVEALKTNDYKKIADLSAKRAAEYSMDASGLAKVFDPKEKSTLEEVTKVAGEEGEKFRQSVVSNHRYIQKEFKNIQSWQTKTGNVFQQALGKIGLGQWAEKVRNSQLKIEDILTTLEKTNAEYIRRSMAVLTEIPPIIEATRLKNRKIKIVAKGLERAITELKKFQVDNASKLNQDRVQQVQMVLSALTTELEITKSIYTSNAFKINQLSTIYDQTQKAAFDLSLRGSESINEIRTNMQVLLATRNVEDMNKFNAAMAKMAADSSQLSVQQLKASNLSLDALKETVMEVARQNNLNADELIKQTMDRINGVQSKQNVAYSEAIIKILDATALKLEKNDELLKASGTIGSSPNVPLQ